MSILPFLLLLLLFEKSWHGAYISIMPSLPVFGCLPFPNMTTVCLYVCHLWLALCSQRTRRDIVNSPSYELPGDVLIASSVQTMSLCIPHSSNLLFFICLFVSTVCGFCRYESASLCNLMQYFVPNGTLFPIQCTIWARHIGHPIPYSGLLLIRASYSLYSAPLLTRVLWGLLKSSALYRE